DRICGHFGFRGGGHAVDAAHSSSLLAVAAACSALAAGDLDAAIAGGVDISLDPFELAGLAGTGVLASGEMRVFDVRPTGFLPGEGCGLTVLMRAAEARSAGLIKATLAIAAGIIPPATGCARPHPLIASEDARLRAPGAAEPWPERIRLAGVTSVGPGGASVHLILRRTRDGRRRRAPGL